MRSQSPASTIFSSPLSGHRPTDQAIRNVREYSTLPPRKLVIRADYTITTNFDPADAELYALWAPAR